MVVGPLEAAPLLVAVADAAARKVQLPLVPVAATSPHA